MKAMVLSVTSIQGLSKGTGNPFSMKRMKFLVLLEEVNSKNFQLHGQGFDVVELEVSEHGYDAIEAAFRARFKGGPVEMQLITGMDRRGQTVVHGVETAAAPAAIPSPIPNRAA